MAASIVTEVDQPAASTQLPDALGRFGAFGGRFVPETLMDALNGMTTAYAEAKADPAFQTELDGYLADYVGRPSPLFHAKRLSEKVGGAAIYLKREDLNHTGAHKINNALGQVMLARRMGKTPRDRGNRRGTARRRHRDRLRPLRHRLHSLYG